MSELDITRIALGVMATVATTIGGALIAVIGWNARAIMQAVKDLRAEVASLREVFATEMRIFDRRVTRQESINERGPIRRADFERDSDAVRQFARRDGDV